MTRDEEIGQRLQALRGPVISQAGLAGAMKERGYEKWSQATVWAIEAGKRPLRLTEAQDLASILSVEVGDLLQSTEVAQTLDALFSATLRVEGALRMVMGSIGELEQERAKLREVMASIDPDDVAGWSESARERLHDLLVDAKAKLKWSVHDLLDYREQHDGDDIYFRGQDGVLD
ncbi:hypothetical protein BRM3_08250 [Brachybacterium huguangmaarense]|uniref:HTH cro/C1-type domain-containing protein n=1 Tax=Brachybacterium huguangmaarense TaxID=1652028 RepID=A0ABY6FXJ7_9MICO|nr:hypothetical protein [Brachybacterium huguangmaarense]UYG15640.1 hypothetical protein BRM3_08250 [Brachybacterium huguangmaarense]